MLKTSLGRTLGVALLAPLLACSGASDGRIARAPLPPYLGFPDHAPAGNWRTVAAFPNLQFTNAVRLVHEPRTHRYYVAEREGRLWSFPDDDPKTKEKNLVLDLSPHTQGYFDSGLLGLAFHPEFGKPGSPHAGEFFVWYNQTDRPKTPAEVEPPRETPKRERMSRFHIATGNRLSRFRLSPGSTRADPASERVLIDQRNETVFHEGGGMFFHPKDAFLYLSLGDDDEPKNAQRLDAGLFSGVIRIDVDCDRRLSHPIRRQPLAGKTAHYCIPNDNPFVDPAGKALEEFWSLGLRSPHTLTVDAKTLDVWSGDVGEAAREEIDLIERGGNYQWPYLEGTLPHAARPAVLHGAERPPAHEYQHGLHACVIGGPVYRGAAFPRLDGHFLFGDNASNYIWALDVKAPGSKPILLARLAGPTGYRGGLASLAAGAHDEILLVRMGAARIFKLIPLREPPPVLPARLSETGAFGKLQPLTPRRGLVPYDVRVSHWADGAVFRRWIAVPDNTTIRFSAHKEWQFPSGSVLVQHLELPSDARRAERTRPVETRFLVFGKDGEGYGVTYRWREDGSDADLVRESATVELPVRNENGREEPQPWFLPGPDDCLSCHSSAAGSALGVSTRQLNRPLGSGGDSAPNQLQAWSDARLFDHALDAATISAAPRLVDPNDASASRRDRVRSYLDVNCSHCHRPGGLNTLFDARASTPFAKTGLLDGEVLNPLNMENARVVAPGDPGRSILFLRLYATGPIAMPPIGKNKVDQRAADLVRDWIAEP